MPFQPYLGPGTAGQARGVPRKQVGIFRAELRLVEVEINQHAKLAATVVEVIAEFLTLPETIAVHAARRTVARCRAGGVVIYRLRVRDRCRAAGRKPETEQADAEKSVNCHADVLVDCMPNWACKLPKFMNLHAKPKETLEP